MAAEAYAVPGQLAGRAVPRMCSRPARGSAFGDVALVLFLLAQCFDGVFTYVGVVSFGIGIEANPIVALLMTTFGHGAALTGAKIVAGVLGICLHLRQVHSAVAWLAGFYFAAAIVPWAAILFF
ncbi:MAG: DUF5658 family protein [Vicinamibacterales bacterium]